MLYYYHLLRFHISSNIHIRNKNNFDKSCKNIGYRLSRLVIKNGSVEVQV